MAAESLRRPARRLINLRDVASELDVSFDTVDRFIRAGKLPVVRLPSGRRRVTREDLDAAIGSDEISGISYCCSTSGNRGAWRSSRSARESTPAPLRVVWSPVCWAQSLSSSVHAFRSAFTPDLRGRGPKASVSAADRRRLCGVSIRALGCPTRLRRRSSASQSRA